ncbi:glycosyltransferase family 4 protein [Candidatus Micrarchaeota archaeon]|nr:glycosyltransferase family 4 protein [Candidatus Micrarchaeota archaeon]
MKVFFNGGVGMGGTTHFGNLISSPPKGVDYFFNPKRTRHPRLEQFSIPKNYAKAYSLSLTGAYFKLPFVEQYYKLRRRDFMPLEILKVRQPDIDLTYAWVRPIIHDKPWVMAFDHFPGKVSLSYPYSMFAKKIIHKIINSNNCKKLMPFSNCAKERMLNRISVPEEKIEVMPPPALASVKPIKRRPETIRMLFVGTWFGAKGGYLLLNAFRELQRKYDNIALDIVGPPYPKPYLDIEKRIGRDDNIKLHGFLPLKDILRLYKKADIFCMPSHCEAFGQVYIEAMNYSLPVVAVNVNAVSEIVEDGKTGFLIPPAERKQLAERLGTLIDSPALRRRMGRAGKERFEKHFSRTVVNKKLLGVYSSALES